MITTIFWILFSLVAIIAALATAYIKWKLGYWERRGFPHIKPEFYWGNAKGVDSVYHQADYLQRMYYLLKLKGPVSGIYCYTVPIAFVTDLKMAQHMNVKDFQYFNNRGAYIHEANEPVSAHLLNVEDNRWRGLRNKMSPFFKTDRFRRVHPIAKKCTRDFIRRLETEEHPELCSLVPLLTCDFFGHVLFSRNFGQLEMGLEKAEHTKVFEAIEIANEVTFLQKVMIEAYRWLLADILKIKSIPKKLLGFFKGLIDEETTDSTRDTANKNDFVDHMLKFYRRAEDNIQYHEIYSNSALLMLIAQDNTISGIKHSLFELSKYPDVQARLRSELWKVMDKYGQKTPDELTYDAMMECDYLDQCVMETFRMYILAIFTKRVARYDYKVPGTNLVIEKGTPVIFPFNAINLDHDIYPLPEVYNPDRMHKSNNVLLTHFGLGPRQCIGFRLGLTIVKTAIALTVLNLEFHRDPTRTNSKILYNPRKLFITSEKYQDINIIVKRIKNPTSPHTK